MAKLIVITLNYQDTDKGREAFQSMRRSVLWYDSDAKVEVVDRDDAQAKTRVVFCTLCWESKADCICA